MTTLSEEKEVLGEVVQDASPEALRRQGRTCASSVAGQSGTSPKSITERVRRAGEVASLLGAMANKPGTILHSQPPTFWQAWDRHKECAAHFNSPLLRALRLLYGCIDVLVVLPPLYLFFWVTESPLRLLVASALIAAIWLFS